MECRKHKPRDMGDWGEIQAEPLRTISPLQIVADSRVLSQ